MSIAIRLFVWNAQGRGRISRSYREKKHNGRYEKFEGKAVRHAYPIMSNLHLQGLDFSMCLVGEVSDKYKRAFLDDVSLSLIHC